MIRHRRPIASPDGSRQFRSAVLAAAVVSMLVALPVGAAPVPRVIGWIEPIRIDGIDLQAVMDSAADGSELHAEAIEKVSVNGERWVRFSPLPHSRLRLLAPLRHEIHVMRDGRPDEVRPVVEVDVCIGSLKKAVQVVLVNRRDDRQPVRLGRNLLAGHFLVDPGHTKLTRPDCGPRR